MQPFEFISKTMKEIIITKSQKGQRLDKYLLKYLNKAPKSFVYKMLRKKNIKLNDKKAQGNEILNENDCIKLYISDETLDSFIENKVIKKADDLDIIYEDSNVIIVNKPPGLIVHPDIKHSENTLNDRLLYYLYNKGEYSGDTSCGFTPSICNRLDRNTGGIVVMGKNLEAVQELNKAFRERYIDKYYITLVKGEIVREGYVEAKHLKSENRVASLGDDGSYTMTKYKPIKTNGSFTLLEIKLETGKFHQIRVAMAHIGHPIVGDVKYGDKNTNKYLYDKYKLKNQILHCLKIIFRINEGPLSYLNNKEFVAPMDGFCEKVVKDIIKK